MTVEIVVWEGPSRYGGRCADCGVRIARGQHTSKVWAGESGTNRGGQGPGRFVCRSCAIGLVRKADPPPTRFHDEALPFS